MKTLKEKILEKIVKEKIVHKPKWYFSIKNIIAWFLTIFSLLVSSIFTSGIVFIFRNQILIPPHTLLLFVFVDLVLFVVLIYLAYHHFHRIKNSYRAHLRHILTISFISLFVLSFIFVQFRLYGKIDNLVYEKVPLLSVQKSINKSWSQPELTGKLAGEIIEIDEFGIISVEDFEKNIHKIDPVLLREKDRDILLEYLRVRMRGFVDESIFYPEDIEPWEFKHGQKIFHKEYKKPFKKGNIYFPLDRN